MELLATPPAGQWPFSCRPIGKRLFTAFFALLLLGIAYGYGTWLIGTTHTDLEILGAVAVAVFGVVVIRAQRLGVWADADRVVVRQLWRTHEFKWADVSRLDVYRYRLMPAWVFKLHSGREICVAGVPYRRMAAKAHALVSTSRTPVEIVG